MTDDRDQKLQIKLQAFAILVTWSRLLTTIAAGVLALSVTFFRVIEPSSSSEASQQASLELPWLLIASWSALFISLVFGAILVGSLSAHLNIGSVETLSTQKPSILWKTFAQWISFLLGILLFAIFGFVNLLAG